MIKKGKIKDKKESRWRRRRGRENSKKAAIIVLFCFFSFVSYLILSLDNESGKLTPQANMQASLQRLLKEQNKRAASVLLFLLPLRFVSFLLWSFLNTFQFCPHCSLVARHTLCSWLLKNVPTRRPRVVEVAILPREQMKPTGRRGHAKDRHCLITFCKCLVLNFHKPAWHLNVRVYH